MSEPDLSHIIEPLRALAVPISTLVPDPENARKHGPENLAAIRASLEENGQYLPLIVQQEGMIVRVGNGRLSQMKELGWTHAACAVVPMERIAAVKLALHDNRTGDLAEWDYAQLKQLISEFDVSEMTPFWDERELSMFMEASFIPPDVADLPGADDVGGPNNRGESEGDGDRTVKFTAPVYAALTEKARDAGFTSVATYIEAALGLEELSA